jgi:DNA-binding response OmpR family regulator
MDGFEATRRIRASMHAGIPIVAVTADAMLEDRNRCLREGMNDYLSKPVELARLADMLAKWLPVSGDPVSGANATASKSGNAPIGRPRPFSIWTLFCGG